MKTEVKRKMESDAGCVLTTSRNPLIQFYLQHDKEEAQDNHQKGTLSSDLRFNMILINLEVSVLPEYQGSKLKDVEVTSELFKDMIFSVLQCFYATRGPENTPFSGVL